jgi:sarcosine oxidase subunit alpha
MLIDRAATIEFTFDGQSYTGLAGDTISSALAAHGRWVLSRSFKYHRPRASVSFAGWDANSYVQVGDEPNVPADLTPIEEGLTAEPQNVLGSVDRDVGALSRWLKPFMPVGFYYRAFFRPRGIWPWWEKLIRRTAGLGRINRDAVHDVDCDKEFLFTDVAVIGGGPAGLSAALEAASHGARVLVVEEGPILGGSLNYARFGGHHEQVSDIRQRLVAEAEYDKRIRIMTNTTCSGWFADNLLSVHSRQRLYKLRAGRVILATGSVEQPAVFGNSDLPGVMTASAAQRLMRLYGIRPGKRAVVIAGNSDGFDVALDLVEAGVELVSVVDLTGEDSAQATGLPIAPPGFVPIRALPKSGNTAITGIEMAREERPGDKLRIECDLVVTSVGYAPLAQLACHQGGCLEYDPAVSAFRLDGYPDGGDVAGSVNHCYDLEAVLADGRAAGARAVGQASEPQTADTSASSVNHPFPIFAHESSKAYVDLDEDQNVTDLFNSVADGFSHPELAKRYSTTAMGPSQGRMSATNALRVVVNAAGGDFTDKTITTQRPPFRPVALDLLAGRPFTPERRTAVHEWHVAHGAEMMPAGLWQRPAYYGEERETAVAEEVASIRRGVGLIDVSTLGGIEVRGPDSVQFLDRLYTFSYAGQEVGRTRYLLMTDDTGSIIDDGVAARLGEDHFYVTTTTTGSDAVFRTMLKRRLEWRLDVEVTNVTSAFAGMNLAGPATRKVLAQLQSSIDFSPGAFPYLAVREGHVNGIAVRAMRVGFVGELGFELHVPTSRGLALWEALIAAGKSSGIQPVGVEAQRILRLEKGHIIVGQDTDGLTTPDEAGMGWAVSHGKPAFVGRTAISSIGATPIARKLVGFELAMSTDTPPEECNLVIRNGEIAGRVTSIAHSGELNKVIGLAYVAPSDSTPGSKISIKRTDGQLLEACVVKLPFLDPEGARQEPGHD